MSSLLGDKLRLTQHDYLVLGECGILLASTDDVTHIGCVAVVQRQVEVTLVLGEGVVDDKLLQAVDEVRLLALQDVDIPELAALDFLAQGGKGYRLMIH